LPHGQRQPADLGASPVHHRQSVAAILPRGQVIPSLQVDNLYRPFANAIKELPHGEYLQIKARKFIEGLAAPKRGQFHQELKTVVYNYLEKSHFKTGALFTNLLVGTGLVCKVAAPVLTEIFQFGTHLGLSFQLADDLKDIKMTTKEQTKDSMNDLKERNTTLPYILTLVELNESGRHLEKEALLKILQKKEKTDEEVRTVFELYKSTRSEEMTQIIIRTMYQEALKTFLNIGKPENEKFASLLQYYSLPFLSI
jgi:geranylgeranyl pyrophosphate synthase